MRIRKKTRQVRAGSLLIGGDAPISIQSMTSLPIEKIDDTVRQINDLQKHGAQMVRLALRTEDSVECLKKIIPAVSIPLCADIHFNYRIALAAIKAGIHKVRINPGNIGDEQRVKEVVRAAKDLGVPIRIGVNGGSLDRKKYSEINPENLVQSALDHVRILENLDFHDIVVSIKSSDIAQTIEANRLFAEKRDYPVHIGLTEAGYGMSCIVQSSIAIGHLLLGGIGDTIRISMTGDPLHEIPVARKILESVGERTAAVKIISCPTCGRTDPHLDILALAISVDNELTSRFEKELMEKGRTITVAVMGCEVNGPGEASHADVGVAGGKNGEMLLFREGEKVKKIHKDEVIKALVDEVRNMM